MGRLNFVNRAGIPAIESVKATLTASGLTYSFNPHPYMNYAFQGLIAVRLVNSPSAPSSAVNVYFDTVGIPGSSVALIDSGGDNVTTSALPGDGVYLCWYDKTTNILRLINTW